MKRRSRAAWKIWASLFARLASPLLVGWYLITRYQLRIQIRTLAFQITPQLEGGVVQSRMTSYILKSDTAIQWKQLPLKVRLARPGRLTVRDEIITRNGRVVSRGYIGVRLFTPWQEYRDERVRLSGISVPVGPIE